MFNIQSLKKMATERIARKFEQIFGWLPFNVYEDREMMIAMLIGNESPEIKQERYTVEPAMVNDIIGVIMIGNKIINRIFSAMKENWFLPQRVESKGRKSQFSYRDVWDMIYAYEAGMKLSEIAKYFSTNSQIIWQILTGKSYQWASGISELSFE